VRRRLALAGAGVALVSFLAAQLLTGASLGSARRELRDGRTSLAEATAEHDRAEAARADRRARAAAARERLADLDTRLRVLELAVASGSGAVAADLLADLEGASADLVGATEALSGRRQEVEALRACFVSVSQALALVSIDQRARGLEVLGSAAPRCREAGAAR
jgi:Flp pilus assembly protein TadB